MRIAFVGKGGAGKSTLAASFVDYLQKHSEAPVAVFDADLNVHMPMLLGFDELSDRMHISRPEAGKEIKQWLIGGNDIADLGAFRKTTPPSIKSNIISFAAIQESPLVNFGMKNENLWVFAVGTYQNEDIGASCYHNNLAILENVLTHFDDKEGYLIADMVAGVDAFAGTLHAQFDLNCFVMEPTARSVAVFKDYQKLAQEAGVADSVFVIANKVRDEKDKEFVLESIPSEKLLGIFWDDEHIRAVDRDESKVSFDKLNDANRKILAGILERLNSLPDKRNDRLSKIHELHKKYVNQAFVKARYGDLSGQIDKSFKFK